MDTRIARLPLTIAIFGPAASGKSWLLQQVATRDQRCQLTDLASAKWSAPSRPDAVDAVMLDHAIPFADCIGDIAAAQAWCAHHGKHLVVVTDGGQAVVAEWLSRCKRAQRIDVVRPVRGDAVVLRDETVVHGTELEELLRVAMPIAEAAYFSASGQR